MIETEGASIAGVVLAGGRGKRLGGVVKASIRLGGIPLLSHVMTAVRRHCDLVVLSIGQLEVDLFGAAGVPILPDPAGVEIGPQGGLAAAVNWFLAQEKIPEFLLTASVDVPFFPEDFAARLLEAVEPDGPGAIARCGDQLHPTHGLWRLSALADLPAEAANRTAPKGMRGLAERLGATEAHFERIEGRDPLAGINTLTDLMNAERVILCRD